MLSRKAYARAGLLGNPSDGYCGETISLIVKNYFAEVTLESSDKLTLVPALAESNQFDSIEQLASSIGDQGYYGGIRLLKAAIKRFYEYCQIAELTLGERPNFIMSYTSSIPRQVGLAGSSAIVMAAIRALMAWYEVEIAPHLLASLTLSAEAELGIPAGLQDRVIQAYEGVVHMDFAESQAEEKFGLTYGRYQELNPQLASHLYIAYASNAGEPTEVLHNDLRKRFNRGDQDVVEAMQQFASFASQGVQAYQDQDLEQLGSLIDQNYDLRAKICQLHSEHQQMIRTARQCGASAKYCGSGGAIVGTYQDESMYSHLQKCMSEIGCQTFQPIIV